MSTILVVDDQKTVCYSLQRLLQAEGYDVVTETNGEKALALIAGAAPDLVIMDVRMPEIDGLEALGRIKEAHPEVQVIMMTAFSTTEKAIQAMKLGAYDYLLKPFDNDELLIRVRGAIKAKELVKEVVTFDQTEDYTKGETIIGKSPVMLDIYKQIGRVATTDATVFIRGESGTGKELVARAVYHYSKRANRPFLAINCAAIPEQLLESELFGHERGAFTGAEFRRIGKCEQCDGGTLFLDEIGDMSLSLQAKVLRFIQDGTFQRIGGNETIKTDVRLIAATNKDIESMVEKGTFREDLFYRINVVTMALPPLRDRREDIGDLVQYFIGKFNKKLGKKIKGFTSEVLDHFRGCAWPGNVRELENTIQKAMVFCKDNNLSLACCDSLKPVKKSCATLEEAISHFIDSAFREGCQERFQDIIAAIEKNMVCRALELTKGNQVQAAKLLGISRNTLRKKLETEQKGETDDRRS